MGVQKIRRDLLRVVESGAIHSLEEQGFLLAVPSKEVLNFETTLKNDKEKMEASLVEFVSIEGNAL